MTGNVKEAAGRGAHPRSGPRQVPPATPEERRMRDDSMARALKLGAALYRDAEGKARYVFFKEANNAPVEPWRRDPRAKRGYRRTQDLRKAAGQLIGQPGDRIEIAKRLAVLHHQEGSDIEGAAARGLHDAVWSREHVYDSFTVPRRHGLHLMDTGRVAAVAEEEARRLQAEDPKARGGFWVRDRRNLGLVYVVPNPDPAPPPPNPAAPPQQAPAARQSATSAQATQAHATADGYFSLLRQNLAPREGGLADRPPHEDPAGRTYKGVTQDTLNDLHQYKSAEYGHYPTDPAKLSDDQIDTILRKEYFDPLHIWKIAEILNVLQRVPQLPEQIFDIGVLHGSGFAGRIVQEAIFEVMGIDLRVVKNGKLDYDGLIGPATRSALAQAVAAGKIVEINNLIVDKRIAELNTKGHKKFNSGWFTRAESFRIAPAVSPGQPGTP